MENVKNSPKGPSKMWRRLSQIRLLRGQVLVVTGNAWEVQRAAEYVDTDAHIWKR